MYEYNPYVIEYCSSTRYSLSKSPRIPSNLKTCPENAVDRWKI